MFGTGSSSFSLPCSTSCIAATVAIAFVMDALRNTVSGVIEAEPASSARGPIAPSYSTPFSVAAIAPTPGTSFASTACFRMGSMRDFAEFSCACRRPTRNDAAAPTAKAPFNMSRRLVCLMGSPSGFGWTAERSGRSMLSDPGFEGKCAGECTSYHPGSKFYLEPPCGGPVESGYVAASQSCAAGLLIRDWHSRCCRRSTVVADQTRRLCIVSRDRLDGRDFLAAVQASVQPEDYLEVIVDRRRGEPSSQWHGANDRRKQPHVDLALQESGVAIVPAATPAGERRREPAYREPSPRGRTSGQRFEDRLVGGEISQEDWSAWPARDPFSQGASSRFASRVATAPDDYRPEPYESSLDDDAERLKAIRGFRQRFIRQEEHPPRSRLPWMIAVLAIAVVLVAVLIALSPLGDSLKQAFKQSLAARRSSETSGTASEASRTASETPHASSTPRASSDTSRAPSATPRATEPAAAGEPSPVPSGDNRELPAANSAPAAGRRAGSSVNEPSAESAAPQTSDGTTAGRRPRPSVSEPAPRRAALPPEPTVAPSEPPGRLMTSPRFPDLPRVDVSREPGSPNGIYSARIVDPAGRPLTDADVLLLARMSDGTVENVMMQFSPDRGIYRGALPATRSSIVYLRLRVITGNKRIEIPVEP